MPESFLCNFFQKSCDLAGSARSQRSMLVRRFAELHTLMASLLATLYALAPEMPESFLPSFFSKKLASRLQERLFFIRQIPVDHLVEQ